jgi:mono/diheme cytochrome c family protein
MRHLACILTVAVLAGCSRTSSSTPPAQAARELFDEQCSTCHGSGGRGDGPAARALATRPRDYTDASWQRSVTDEQIRTVILKGGAAVGKSAQMPANPQLKDRPDVVDALVAIVRGFGPT